MQLTIVARFLHWDLLPGTSLRSAMPHASASRRTFLKTIVAGTSAALFSPAASYARIIGSNERVGVGVIGVGGMGGGHLNNLLKLENAQVTALSDVYEERLAKAREKAPQAATHKDFRQLLERSDVDAVVVASPDHWHALQAILAMEAGKDVYVEKPIALTIAEGRAMVEATNRYDRIVQVGTQQRTAELYQRVRDVVRSGALGPISFIRTWNYGNNYPDGIGMDPDGPPPAGLDWDMWLGPAPQATYNPNRYEHWRWFWDYAGGNITDWGTHHFDIVHWAMDVEAPRSITAVGGKLHIRDNRETPDTMVATYEYPGFVVAYETRFLNANPLEGRGYGIAFHGTNGTLIVDRSRYEIIPENGSDLKPEVVEGNGNAHAQHMHDFLEAVKARTRPISDIESGHRASSATMLGNVAFRTGRRINWDAANEVVIEDPEANDFVSKTYRTPWAL